MQFLSFFLKQIDLFFIFIFLLMCAKGFWKFDYFILSCKVIFFFFSETLIWKWRIFSRLVYVDWNGLFIKSVGRDFRCGLENNEWSSLYVTDDRIKKVFFGWCKTILKIKRNKIEKIDDYSIDFIWLSIRFVQSLILFFSRLLTSVTVTLN